ncbi:hypothetical protein AVDCRST_MAG81-4635 [uncultured Synechococcales cyanobacterium]|uniref:Uncharacterized protein n=1 Tax=uncultured Synechococcales cyanobacterium TaxID=1936017 RepID=A0A6J4VVH1_9CYAN|nr:hypothetical protein AVDCRST_MAG81-4635 [uncultured Synechococcales cyanobacterium]
MKCPFFFFVSVQTVDLVMTPLEVAQFEHPRRENAQLC